MSQILQGEVPGTAVLVDNTGQWYQVRVNSSTAGIQTEVVDITGGIQSADTSFARPLVPQFLSAETIVFHEHKQLQHPWETAEDGLTSGFSQLHVGQKLQLSTSGSALITRVKTEHRRENYTAWARAHVFKPFQFETLSTSPAQAYSVEVACESDGKSLLTLKNVGGSMGWLFSDVGKSLVVATGNNHLLTEVVTMTTARADPGMTCKEVTITAGMWHLYDFNSYREYATVYDQALTISSTTATVTTGYFEFASYHIGLVLQVSTGSATITGITSVTQVTLLVPGGSLDGSYPAGEWSLQDVRGKQARRKWNITEDECRHIMNVKEAFLTNNLRYLDVREDVRLAANATIAAHAPEVPGERALLVVTFGDPMLFQKIETDASWDRAGYHHLTLHIVHDLLKQGHSSVTVYLPGASMLCPLTSHTVTLRCQCPPNKHMHYVYHNQFTEDEFLHGHPVDKDGRDLLQTLEVNYRPPSSMGVGIPLSNNIYNADPSQDRPNDFYQVSQETGQYKQCLGKSTRAECGCTKQMKLSSLEKFSDCIDRAHRMLYPAELSVRLQVVRPGTETIELDQPYVVVIEEVNSRSDYVPDSVVTPSLARLRADRKLNHTLMYYSPRKLSVLMTGARLYHFRVSALEGFSYCNLVAEFIIYVDRPPIAYPSEYIMRGGISIMIGMILFLVYLYYLHTHHTPFTRKSTSQHAHLNREQLAEQRRNMSDTDSDED
ncbi:cation channel sperm-associated protein subunit beta-like [Branchiostoma floridae]|uniref:Cation channel sperm-associated protein subunit beta-like n=1 Tax=Branchiostoma floridae TaxID=7739 RepID=A0A9J7MW72_BRAFL|nr:cation channel sperm-associated protein subunit beta-like [Branchiostoma floridae]